MVTDVDAKIAKNRRRGKLKEGKEITGALEDRHVPKANGKKAHRHRHSYIGAAAMAQRQRRRLKTKPIDNGAAAMAQR